ncbi:MAG: DUF4249 domain-containing protein [Bacteroidales bacterium]|nr:DUF4249 domain-containing protein [Bacteroidales bacterium]
MKNLIIIIIGLIAFISCEEYMDINIEGSDEQKLVVEGMITTDTVSHTVTLSWWNDFFDKGPQIMETGATVTISDGENTILLSEQEPGVYKTDPDVYGIVGKTYTLNIRLKNDSVFTTTDKLTPLPEIDSVVPVFEAGFDPNAGSLAQGYYISYYGPEPAGLGHCYIWNMYLDGILQNDSLQESVFTNDDFVDGNYIKDFKLFFVPEAALENDTTPVVIEMFSISKAYHDFLTGLLLETVWKGSPWDGPPANAVSNISNGAIGFFRASDRKTAATQIIKMQLPPNLTDKR